MGTKTPVTRRAALVAGTTATALGALALASSSSPSPKSTTMKMPVAYVPHGGGPWPFVDLGMDPTEFAELSTYLKDALRALPQVAPKALLVVSAHWEEAVPTVMTAARPPILYDYYGFPPESYSIPWPAPGQPALARRVVDLLKAARLDAATDDSRGFDHGTFVPLKLTYPNADVPTVQLSLKAGLDPAEHLAMGRALAPLRDEGVFIVGSGMSYHNMRGFRDGTGRTASVAFDSWLRETAALEPGQRDARLTQWASAPGARASHPREEHLLPLMVIAGAAGDSLGRTAFNGTVFGTRVSAFHFA